jgi:hypothetical protein
MKEEKRDVKVNQISRIQNQNDKSKFKNNFKNKVN